MEILGDSIDWETVLQEEPIEDDKLYLCGIRLKYDMCFPCDRDDVVDYLKKVGCTNIEFRLKTKELYKIDFDCTGNVLKKIWQYIPYDSTKTEIFNDRTSVFYTHIDWRFKADKNDPNKYFDYSGDDSSDDSRFW